MKKIIAIFGFILALSLLSVAVIGFNNHVRWNPNLDECVYYFTQGTLSHQCYVPEMNCVKDGRDHVKDVDAKRCYYTPRKSITLKPTTCKEFTEGDLIKLDYKGTDPDKDIGPAGKLIYTFGKPFDNKQEWQTKRGDAGNYTVNVTVSDGEYNSTQELCFKILPGNHIPVLKIENVTVKEGEELTLKPICTDEDGDKLTITYSGDMSTDSWTPSYNDAGEYNVTVSCTDGFDTVKNDIKVTVENVNRPPVLKLKKNIVVDEGETVFLTPDCTDPEGENVTLLYSGDMTSSIWKTGYDDAGEYTATVTCQNKEGLKSTGTTNIKVRNVNRPPSITAVLVLS